MGDVSSVVSERLVYKRLSRFRSIRIHLGTKKLKIRQNKLLSVIWGGGLDTECSICGNIFDKESGPPVRTISLESTKSPPENLMKPSAVYRPIRIHNRHMRCIKNSGLDFVPVSHVWHDAVALAHSSKQANDEATALVYQIPLRTLLGVAKKYGQTVEIWHDYISIPQWQYEVQQRLLFLLPAIFAANEKSLVHLDDRSCADLAGLNDSSSQPNQFWAKYAHFFTARWFQRMWVILERASSKNLAVLSRDFILLDLSLREMEINAVNLESRAYLGLGHDLYFENLRATQRVSPGRVKNLYDDSYSFGTALDAISSRECREYRDRFVAICGFFPKWSYESIVQSLPANAVEACLWVAKECLKNGDYTPLLIANGNERSVPGASWLTCHNHMDMSFWKWGDTLAPAASKPLIDTGKIKITVQPVGSIEQHLVLNLPKDDILAFEYYIREIVKVTGRSASHFVSCCGRIYRITSFTQNPPKSIDGSATLDLDLISTKLDSYLAQNDGEIDRSHDIAKEIFDTLQLSAEMNATTTCSLFSWYFSIFRGDCLTHVRCNGCRTLSIFRLNMWKTPPPGTQLYRIPGLQFQYSLANGVGVAIHENRIIGVMMWGTPACACHNMETVVIE